MRTRTSRRVEMPARRLSPSFRARTNLTIEPLRTRRSSLVGWIWIVARPSTFVRTSCGAWIHRRDAGDEHDCVTDDVAARVGHAKAARVRVARADDARHELDARDDEPVRKPNARRRDRVAAVGEARRASGGVTTAVGCELAVVEPVSFLAVTLTRSRLFTSEV